MPSLLVDEIHRFPIFEYRCPACLTDYGTKKQSVCVKCGASFHDGDWRYPIRRETIQKIVYSYYMRLIGKDPEKRKFKDAEARSVYVHKVLAPRLSPLQRKVLFIYFTEYLNNGFEEGDFSAWTGTSTSAGETATVESTDPYLGTHHAQFYCDASGTYEYAYVYKTGFNEPVFYARWYHKFVDALPATNKYYQVVSVRGSADVGRIRLRNISDDIKWELGLRDGASWLSSQSGAVTVNLNQWYSIEIYVKINGTTGTAAFYLDNVETLTRPNQDTDDYGNVAELRLGLVTSSGQTENTQRIDCVVVADAYIGPEAEAGQQPFTLINEMGY